MESNNDRLRDIQQRKEEREREARKKRIMALRCAAAVIFAAVIFLIVFGVKSCVGAISEKRAEKAALEEQARIEAMRTAEPQGEISTAGNVDNAFYKNSAFVGNSFIDGMEIYELVDGADYFARIGLTVKDAMSLKTSSGNVAVIDELAGDIKYKKIFMMFGENELGWKSAETFKEYYVDLIHTAREYQPNASIYLLAITPVTKEVSDEGEDGATKENIEKLNKVILEIAKEENVNFANIHSAVADKDGYLPAAAASDGIHFDEEYYRKCLVYIQNAFKN